MIENSIENVNKQNIPYKLYSQIALGIATYLGGPLAAGILVRRNFISLGKEDYGKHALFIGILSTILLFVGILSIPEYILDKIPNMLIPGAYTIIIYFIVEKLQGKALKDHKNSNGEFYSGWKAAGIGVLSSIVIIAGVLSYAFLLPEDFDTEKYNSGFIEFQQNEEAAQSLLNSIQYIDPKEAANLLRQEGIPIWEKNVQITIELDKIEGLYKEYIFQNKVLREYCLLRIQSYELIEKALLEDTNKYDEQLAQIGNKIDALYTKLQ